MIGINEQIATDTGGNQGLGFAVPINQAVKSMDQLKSGGSVEYAWIGVGGQTLTPDVAKAAGLHHPEPAPSSRPSRAAARRHKAGHQGRHQQVDVGGQPYTVGGDVIVKADSTEIASFDDLIAFLATKSRATR